MPDALGLDVDRSTLTAAVLAPGGSGTPTDLAPVDTIVDGDDDSLVAAVRAVVSARDDDAVVVLAVAASAGPDRIAALRLAFDDAGLQRVRFVNSAVAAAADRAGRAGGPAGACIAVVELRRAATDVALLNGMPDGSFAPVAPAHRVAGFDEQAMDDAIVALVAAGIDGGLPEPGGDDRTDAALARLHAAARVARQRLADDDSTFVSVRLPGRATVVEVQRADFESAVRDRVSAAMPALVAAIGAADLAPAEVLVVGSGAPAGLVAELLAEELGREVVADESVLAVVHGAARMARESIAVTEPVSLPILPAPADQPIAAVADAGPVSDTPDAATPAEPPAVGVARRPRAGLLRYWPVLAAAGGLVLLGGAAAAVTLSPVPEAVNPFVGANGSTSHIVGTSAGPSSVFAGASSSPETDAGSAPHKRGTATQAPAAPGADPGAGTVPAPADSSAPSDPSPAGTDTASPEPSGTETASPEPTGTETASPGTGDGSDPGSDPASDPTSDPVGDLIGALTGS
ncbi:MAG TPA: hypothetical protein VN759_07165 [Pseudolysinimonas sp.]|nr:hypothetical protein [Pseudolysinimonas sp.]